MKKHKLKERLQKNRPMTMISLRMPEDVVEDLKYVAPKLGFSGYQPLIRAYVGQGLRADLARLEKTPEVIQLVENLKKYGVKDEIIDSAMADLNGVRQAA
ncbi:MAG TPA: hypothetical protein G4N96_00045 [Chloroflexi bacterium]|nr:MAG: hypothetical protein B6243_07575 [Anaerolineaceae bacterium 4572_5.2]HEY83491.1 hypothetical protein [Chloroflexota bacterium]